MRVAESRERVPMTPIRTKPKQILREVAEKHELRVADLLGPSRRRTIAWARHEAFDKIYRQTNMSLPQIGDMFAMDHTSVLYGIWAHRKRKEQGKVI